MKETIEMNIQNNHSTNLRHIKKNQGKCILNNNKFHSNFAGVTKKKKLLRFKIKVNNYK